MERTLGRKRREVVAPEFLAHVLADEVVVLVEGVLQILAGGEDFGGEVFFGVGAHPHFWCWRLMVT